MIRRFPREQVFLERTRLRYIDLPNVLSDGKVVRASRVPGFVVLYVGEELDLIFLLDGEPATAMRRSGRGTEVLSVSAAVERAAAEREHADIAFYGAPEPQLRAMFATARSRPLQLDSTPDLTRPRRSIARLAEQEFNGVLEVREDDAVHYLTFADGKLSDARIAGRLLDEPCGIALKRLLQPPRNQRLRATPYPRLDALPVQAPAALIELYTRTVEAAVRASCAVLGDAAGGSCFREGLDRALGRHPLLEGCRIEPDGMIVIETVAAAEELTDGVADWLFEALSAAQRSGDVEPAELIERVTRENRFALAAQGFFNRLPWPVAV